MNNEWQEGSRAYGTKVQDSFIVRVPLNWKSHVYHLARKSTYGYFVPKPEYPFGFWEEVQLNHKSFQEWHYSTVNLYGVSSGDREGVDTSLMSDRWILIRYEHMFYHLILIIILQNRFPCAHFIVEETGAQRGQNLYQISQLGMVETEVSFSWSCSLSPASHSLLD